QGRQVTEGGDDGARLVERADEVLADGMVEAGLAADRRVDHGEQRGRHLNEAPSAEQARRRKAPEVSDDAAARRDDDRVPIDAPSERGVPDRARARERLLGLASP